MSGDELGARTSSTFVEKKNLREGVFAVSLTVGAIVITAAILFGIAVGATSRPSTLDIRDWLSFFGNILGGGVGAIGAYLAFELGVRRDERRSRSARTQLVRAVFDSKLVSMVGIDLVLRNSVKSIAMATGWSDAPQIDDQSYMHYPTISSPLESELSQRSVEIYVALIRARENRSKFVESHSRLRAEKSQGEFHALRSRVISEARGRYDAHFVLCQFVEFACSIDLKTKAIDPRDFADHCMDVQDIPFRVVRSDPQQV